MKAFLDWFEGQTHTVRLMVTGKAPMAAVLALAGDLEALAMVCARKPYGPTRLDVQDRTNLRHGLRTLAALIEAEGLPTGFVFPASSDRTLASSGGAR